MSTVAIIPARGGSKGILDKNLQPVHGIPLVARAVRSAVAAVHIDQVYVSTDSSRIASVAEANGAKVINRPASISGDEASSESAILHALDDIKDADVVAFIQCTSPFIDPHDLDKACRTVSDGEADVVISVVDSPTFQWEETDGFLNPLGHSRGTRQRRQAIRPRLMETGAFYVFKEKGLRDTGSRFHGRIQGVRVAKRSALEIDSAEDLSLARELAMNAESSKSLGPLDAVVCDFDGVHTDDHVWVDEKGVESVRVSRSDGYGIQLLREAGYTVLILSTEKNPVVAARAKKLDVEVIQGQDNKADALETWLEKNSIDASRVAYLANDVNDIPALERVGWPVVVADAHPSVKVMARISLRSNGGEGAVRELADLILQQESSDS